MKAFSQHDVQGFLQLTGDSNPIHSDAAAACLAGRASLRRLARNPLLASRLRGVADPWRRRVGFASGPIVPGMLLASMFPAIIGSTFPGAVYISQTLNFRSPAAVGVSCTHEPWFTAMEHVREGCVAACMYMILRRAYIA